MVEPILLCEIHSVGFRAYRDRKKGREKGGAVASGRMRSLLMGEKKVPFVVKIEAGVELLM